MMVPPSIPILRLALARAVTISLWRSSMGPLEMLNGHNKLDLLEQAPRIDRNADGQPERVWLSAVTGEGVELLLQAVSELVGQDMVNEELELSPDQGGLRAALYRLGAVESEDYADDGTALLQVRLPRADWNRLMKKGPEPLF